MVKEEKVVEGDRTIERHEDDENSDDNANKGDNNKKSPGRGAKEQQLMETNKVNKTTTGRTSKGQGNASTKTTPCIVDNA